MPLVTQARRTTYFSAASPLACYAWSLVHLCACPYPVGNNRCSPKIAYRLPFSALIMNVTSPQNDSLSTLLARLEGILGPVPEWMLHKGRYAHRFYTRSGMLYERNATTQKYDMLQPKRTSLRHRCERAAALCSGVGCAV